MTKKIKKLAFSYDLVETFHFNFIDVLDDT